MIETERLLLREYTEQDFPAIHEILSDPETMRHYPKPFDEERTRGWINWNLENYRNYGFGLWAVVLKETGELIGDCGLTIQDIDGEKLPEIGYHINKKYWRRGYGSEAARAVRDWAFRNTDYDCLYSYMKYTNVGSYSTAMANGMKKMKEYPDEKNGISYAYAITRAEWELLKLSVRKARMEDAEALREMYRELEENGVKYQPEHFVTGYRDDDFFKGIFASETQDILVAETNGRVVGFSHVMILEQKKVACLKPQTAVYLQDLDVRAEMRGRGIGTKLMEASKEYGLARGANFIRTQVFPNNTDGIRFYERSGFSEMMKTMECQFERSTPSQGTGSEEISLSPMTRELCHRLFRDWRNDPATFVDMSQFTEFRYDPAWVDRRFDERQSPGWAHMAVLKDGEPIGELCLKRIDLDKKECALGIHMQNDSVKGRGYGTRAEQLAVKYAFDVLGLDAVNADAIVKNTRSQHVLEKSGFRFIKEENGFRYYRCERGR